MSATKAVQRFSFSKKNLAALEALFAGEGRAKAFTRGAQQIVARHHPDSQDDGELPPVTALRANARAIEAAARSLSDALKRLSGAETALVGQFMWIVDKINYYPGASSVERSLQTIAALRAAAHRLASRGSGGRSGLRLEGLIRELHAGYVTSFKARPTISGARDNAFMSALRICLLEAGIPRPANFLEVVREALGEAGKA